MKKILLYLFILSSIVWIAPSSYADYQGTIGTRFTIGGESFGYSKSKVYLLNGTKKAYAKVEYWSDTSITCLWTKKISPGTYPIFVQPKGKGVSPISAGNFTIMQPIIDEITPNNGIAGDTIKINGWYFTNKKPKVYFEDPNTNKRKSCKVISFSMDPQTGSSTLQLVIPKWGLENYNLILISSISQTSKKFPILQTVQGNLVVAADDNTDKYTVFNSNQSSTPSAAGSFSTSVARDSQTYTYAISDTGKKVYAAVSINADGSNMTINAQSTAEAMVLLCPLLIPNNVDERIKIINIARSDAAVRSLASVIDSVYGSVQDPLSDTRISDALTNAVKSVLTSWQTSNESVATALQQTIRKSFALIHATSASGSPLQIINNDMGALTLDNSVGTTLKLELSNDVGPWGITTNIDWVVRIVELDPTKIQFANSGVPILPTDINIDNLIKTGGYDEKTIIEGSVASGLLGVAFDPIGWISDSINASVFPDAGINLPYDGVYAVIAFSGSPFGGDSGEEYNSVIKSEWQKALWAEAAGINICAAAIDIVGVGTTFVNAAGAEIPDLLSPVLEVELGFIKEELSKNPNYLDRASITAATGYFFGKAGDISKKLLDLLRPHIQSLSSLSNQEFSGWQILIHKSLEVVTSVVDVWSGTISASTRILNYLNSVTPRESGYAVLGTFSGQAPSTPTDFSVTAASSSQINLAWTASTGTLTGYKIYKSGGSLLKTVTTTSTSDTGLNASTNYCYYVIAYNSAGDSVQTSQLCATTQAPPLSPPSTPTGFTVTPASSSQINLAWTASTGTVTGYKIYKSGGSLLKTVTTTSTSDTGLNASTNYCYYVIAYNSAGDSVQTSQLCATTQNLTSTYSITGSVTLNGSGLSGVTITLTGTGSTSTITNSNGNYTFADAQNGSYTVTPSMTGYTFTPANQAVTINGANATASNFIASAVPAQFSQQGPKLVGSGSVGAAYQGWSVSLSADGNTAIVGGRYDSPAGAAWVWTRNGGVWTQQGNKLVGSGASVSLSSDGNTAIVGDCGAVWVWTRSGGVWTQQGSMLVGSGAVGNACQGYSVSLSADGNTAIVGGYLDNSNAGAAWIWTRSGGVWTQQGNKLVGSGASANAQQGISVSLSADGDTAIVGGNAMNFGGDGAAWVWTRSGGVWTQQGTKLVGSGAVGNAYQGISVSLSADGNTAIVGGNGDNNWTGAAWVWTRNGGIWTQQGNKLVGSGGVGEQGHSVSLSADGNTAIVGGSINDGGLLVWARSGGVWTQQGNKLVGSGSVGYAFQGVSGSLSADGSTAIVGGYGDNSHVGAAWVFTAVP